MNTLYQTSKSNGRNGQIKLGRKARQRPPHPQAAQPVEPVSGVMESWLRTQSINVTRHAAALRPFRKDEFGTIAAAPTEAHIQAVNDLLKQLRDDLLRASNRVNVAATGSLQEPTTTALQRMLVLKERAHNWVRSVERIWDFYFELFGQRQSRFGDWLLGCDRIALDCYQASYRGLGAARSVPTPPPFSYMRTGFSPATFRRGIPLRRLGQQINPFPLIQLPYHRLINPWTLGAVLHEVSHNLQNDLGLARSVPETIASSLQDAGMSRRIAVTWTRWNRELFADLCGLLLGGPTIVGSLMDVVGRSPATVLSFDLRGPHPTPYLRTLMSVELLRRMGFAEQAEAYLRVWLRLYPDPRRGSLPRELLETFPEANRVVIDAVCFQPFPSLGNRSLAQVMRFEAKDQVMIEEAARRLAAGIDPGIIPERFLIGAARVALDQRIARPGAITEHFFKELARR
jgi:hypothetical protein